MSTAQTLAKYDAMNARVDVLLVQVAELRAGLDRMQEHQRNEAAAKAASAEFRKEDEAQRLRRACRRSQAQDRAGSGRRA
jgi:hypothetical protein